MWSKPSGVSDLSSVQPAWFGRLLGVTFPAEGESLNLNGARYVMRQGIPRAEALLSETQAQTRDTFEYIWSGTERFQSKAGLDFLSNWYKENYGDVVNAEWWKQYGHMPLLLDVGCGAGLSALGLFEHRLKSVHYLGVDVSNAVEAASQRFAQRGIEAAFLQVSLMNLPLPDSSVDVVYAQGVLHHTDSTEAAIHAVARKLKSKGRVLFYVYRRKGPVREFTDDYIRTKLRTLPPEQAWVAMMPLTKLGKLLGDLDVEIDVPESIELLDIPAGKIKLQRFFYWHLFKAFYHSDMTLDELNHINLDWYAPINAHRQTSQQVRAWCDAAGLVIEREHLQDSGISIIARKG